MERRGAIEPLGIPQAAGLVEQVHVVFFPNQIVGAEFNFYGPRLSRLERYFAIRADGVCPSVKFEPLLRQDVTEQLNRLADLRLFHLKIHASYASVIAEADEDLGSAFKAAARAGQAEELEIILRPQAHSRGVLSEGLLRTARWLGLRRDLREEASRFIVKGLDSQIDRVDVVDILKDQLISRKRIVLEDKRTRALDSESAYAAIEESYTELRAELIAAAGVQL